MILPDVNVLVYAFHQDSDDHQIYATWLAELAAGADELALVDTVLSGFVRIVTNARIFADPAPTGTAMSFVGGLLDAPRARWLSPGRPTWKRLQQIVRDDALVRGDRIPDAYLAAVCLAHNARLATKDRGFARYEGVQLVNPLDQVGAPRKR